MARKGTTNHGFSYVAQTQPSPQIRELTVAVKALQSEVPPFSSRESPVQEAIRKADVLIEALGWIRQFRDRHVVIKLGGSALEDPDAVRGFLTDVIFMATVGMRPILVHGGGKEISRAMNEAGIEPRFVHGRRYTDEATLGIVGRVLAEDICQSLVDEIRKQGGQAIGFSYLTENCLIAEKLTVTDEDGQTVDLGYVGQIVDINHDLLEQTCRSGTIPVLPSIALDANNQKLNVNADTAAAAVAGLMRAEKLVFLSDVPGIFSDKDDSSTLVSHLEAERCRESIANGTLAGRRSNRRSPRRGRGDRPAG